MLKIYYRIWVSLFLKIQLSQNGNKYYSLIMSLLALSVTNFINILLIITILVLSGTKINIFEIFPENRMIRNISILLVFLLPNYFLLIYNNKYQLLLDKYESQNIKNLGIKYFFVSTLLFLLLVIITMIFPEFFNLTVKK
ncbi:MULTISPECIES: hypothetical protein [Flavobacterium]|uniref:Uncharacterized protein n=1 Tax=Flavobacterium ranwuense TaxID=2541725 RepID=A0ABY2DMQ9_9FLAO|nr:MULTISPECIES: hypothetical protein [Flavobacterium]TDE27063.1 hypothetical protein E0I61_15565 [Flavobacterium ranwuense]TDE50957.1 hypothetical protein E0H99_12705 [Flavobacterium sp. GT3P67]